MNFLKLTVSISLLLNLSYGLNCSSTNDVKKYNGHYYAVTIKKLTFNEAKQFAKANDGYLAIPNSAGENNFIQGLIPKPDYAWIGVYDPQYTSNYCYDDTHCAFDDSRFVDIKGNPLSYTKWAKHQPDNLVKPYDVFEGKQMVSPLGEHWVAMGSTTGEWADFGNHYDEYNNPVKQYAVIEFDKMPNCYTPPSNVKDTYKGSKCNTKIYDNTTGTVTGGQTFTCQKDKDGNEYCPSALAPCGQEWQHKDGYAVSHTGNVRDYTDKIGNSTYSTPIPFGNKCSSYGVGCGKYAFSWDKSGKQIIGNLLKQGKVKVYYNSKYVGSLTSLSEITRYHDQCDGFGIATNSLSAGCFDGKCNRGSHFSFCVAQTCDPVQVITYGGAGCEKHPCVGYYCKNTDYVGCPNGYKKTKLENGHYGCVSTTWSCPNGFRNNGGNCVRDLTYNYYQYLCSGESKYGQPYKPINSGYSNYQKTDPNPHSPSAELTHPVNSSNPPHNNCKAKNFVCKPAPDRKCVYVDNKWQCSPFPCFGAGDGDYNVTNADTPVGKNDAKNNGWNNNGSCAGKLYIFNGKDNRCRSKDTFFGLTGGGCCDKDKVFAGLVSCKEDEKNLAKQRIAKKCHFVGEYCSKKLNLLVGKICIQHKQTYCCFNSKLARIMNEQGRPQLHKGWGSPKEPNCKGFTPEEFQKLDFSKMDLSEFTKDITQKVSSNVVKNIGKYVKNSVSSQLGNMKTK
jgi:conjugal transfer mating pair stabilization protein TraN